MLADASVILRVPAYSGASDFTLDHASSYDVGRNHTDTREPVPKHEDGDDSAVRLWGTH